MNTIILEKNSNKLYLNEHNDEDTRRQVRIKKLIIEPADITNDFNFLITCYKTTNNFIRNNLLKGLFISFAENAFKSDAFVLDFNFSCSLPQFQQDSDLPLQRIKSGFLLDNMIVESLIEIKHLNNYLQISIPEIFFYICHTAQAEFNFFTFLNTYSDADMPAPLKTDLFNFVIDISKKNLSLLTNNQPDFSLGFPISNTDDFFNSFKVSQNSIDNDYNFYFQKLNFQNCIFDFIANSVVLKRNNDLIYSHNILNSESAPKNPLNVGYITAKKNQPALFSQIYIPMTIDSFLFLRLSNGDLNTFFRNDKRTENSSIIGFICVKELCGTQINVNTDELLDFTLLPNSFLEFINEREEVLDFKSCLILY